MGIQRTPRLDDRRERLIAAAAVLFHTHGYERCSVRQLAEAVGIRSGSVFHHFDSKEAILLAVMETTIETMIQRLQAAAAAESEPRRRLRALVHAELELLHGDTRPGVAVTFFQWHCLEPGNQANVLKLRDAYEAIWLDVLAEARQIGLIGTDPFITRRLLTGSNGWTIYWYRSGGPMSLDELADEICRLFLDRITS